MKVNHSYLFIIALIVYLFLPSQSSCQNDSTVLRFLSHTTSFDNDRESFEKNYPWTVIHIDLTPYSYVWDSIDVFRGHHHINYAESDFFKKLLLMKSGEIIREKTDSLETYYKCVEADSLLHIGISYITYDLKLRLNIDSIFKEVSVQLKNGKSWSDLFKRSSMPLGIPTYDNTHGWTRTDDLEEGFIKNIVAHKKGDLFLYKSERYQMVWFIRKNETERYFKSRKIVMVKNKL